MITVLLLHDIQTIDGQSRGVLFSIGVAYVFF